MHAEWSHTVCDLSQDHGQLASPDPSPDPDTSSLSPPSPPVLPGVLVSPVGGRTVESVPPSVPPPVLSTEGRRGGGGF